ncbi:MULTISPECIES: hypothetical protein [unclassified Microbacterium]|uniref:hypothetical protein n=1 Tax=unclassified Microbacterium TaxID=2609290 RepID=UPI00214B4C82|nr:MULTISPECIES: hypothetical protein [unclassified Microbacterium]MCR2808864.1 hypothetical protein [Microbacterium sp. zg.B185]WIM18717.1 hypothetical protein QNO12_14155 [Microbacterium sp. zg-B185]
MIDIDAASGWSFQLAHAALATLATLLTVGVAFLSRPGKATLYWSCAFTLAMVATFGVAASEANGSELIRRICLGALMGGSALLWSGFRAYWAVRPFVWVGPVVGVLSAIALVATGDGGGFSVAYRVVFLVASAFAILLFVDWLRFGDRGNRLLQPLMVISVAFGVVGIGNAVAGLIYPPTTGDDLIVVRSISSIGLLLYVASALVAILGLSWRERSLRSPAAAPCDWEAFELGASDRLASAQRTAEQCSIVYLRMDDAAEIRQAAGTVAQLESAKSLTRLIRSAFPPDCSVCPDATGTFVLIPHPDATVRALLSSCLEQVGQLEVPGQLPVHPSASAGWAATSTLGYDLNTLILMSREAAILASQNGGDRWERMSAAVVRRLLMGEGVG